MTERDYHTQQAAQEAGELCRANLQAILEDWGAADVAQLARCLYKYTPCGPWLSVKLHNGEWKHSDELADVKVGDVRALLVGSIIEGSDAEVTGNEFDLLTDDPIDEILDRFDAEVEDVDDAASEAAWQ